MHFLYLLVQRFAVSKEIGEIKATHRFNETDRYREQDNIDHLVSKPEGKLDRYNISTNFRPIYHIAKK